MDQAEQMARLRLIRTRSIGPMTYGLLMQRYSSVTNAVAAILELEIAGLVTRHYGNRVARIAQQ